jgi:hypothetical protein
MPMLTSVRQSPPEAKMDNQHDAREALTLAANRMDRAALDYQLGSVGRSELTEWAAEARAAAIAARIEGGGEGVPAGKVYLVATGVVLDGQETYTRHDVRPPLCDAETLYASPPSTPEPAGRVEAAAWMHIDDPRRVISAMQKDDAVRDGGASASSVSSYSMPLIHAHEATAPQAVELSEANALRNDHPLAGGQCIHSIPMNQHCHACLPTKSKTAALDEAEIEECFQEAAGADEETHIRFARAIERAVLAKAGIQAEKKA